MKACAVAFSVLLALAYVAEAEQVVEVTSDGRQLLGRKGKGVAAIAGGGASSSHGKKGKGKASVYSFGSNYGGEPIAAAGIYTNAEGNAGAGGGAIGAAGKKGVFAAGIAKAKTPHGKAGAAGAAAAKGKNSFAATYNTAKSTKHGSSASSHSIAIGG